jgi:protein-tyrosine sulfotransferase
VASLSTDGQMNGQATRTAAEAARAFDLLEEPLLDPPIFILCSARSGSTLLRYALDAHPEICCPAELNVAEALAQIGRVHTLVEIGASRNAPPAQGMPPVAIDACRRFTDSTIGACARGQAKRRWADKSLVNALSSELLYQVYPEARYICLFRSCADFIASAHEASPWGMAGYGFEPYIRESPANSVLAMARYWADHVDAMLNFRAKHPESSVSVRYEDLVADPQEALETLFVFLETSDTSVPSSAQIFNEKQRAYGPQDHKISFTSEFDSSSIGRGWRVPTEMIPPQLRERIDQLSDQLGYERLEGQLEDAVLGTGSNLSVGRERSPDETGELRELIVDCLGRFFETPNEYAGLASMKFLVPDLGECWIVDFEKQETRQSEESCASTLIVDGTTFAAILDGARNAASEVRRGALRAVGPTAPNGAADVQRYLDAFLSELRSVIDMRRCLRVGANAQILMEV